MFYTYVRYVTVIWCIVPEIWSVMDRIFCCFRPFFVLLPLQHSRNQNFEKMKKASTDIIILHSCTKDHDHMLYCFWDKMTDGCNFYSFCASFCPFLPKITFLKNKDASRYHHFTHVHQKLWSHDVWFLRWMDRWTGGQKKWHIEVSAPPENSSFFLAK